MTDFYPAAPRAAQYSRDELFEAAASGGVLTSIGYGYACSNETPAPQHGFRFQWINTAGMGNHGSLVLIGTTPETRRALLAGRAKAVATELSVSLDTAAALLRAARGVRRGHEPAVLRAAIALACLPLGILDSYPGSGGGADRWRRRVTGWRCDEHRDAVLAISCPRLDAAVEVAQAVIGG